VENKNLEGDGQLRSFFSLMQGIDDDFMCGGESAWKRRGDFA